MDPERIREGMLWFVAFLFSTTVHEAAHAWVALRGGDRTAYAGGQVSLNPIPHIRREPIGMLAVPLFTAFTQGWALGWASAPYNAAWAHQHPRRAAWMALAGPLGNFAIALVAGTLLVVGLHVGWFVAPEMVSMSQLVEAATPAGATAFAARMLSVFLMLNVLLGAFNLMPLPPLDGAGVVNLFLPVRLARRWQEVIRSRTFALVGMLVAWGLFARVARPLFHVVVRVILG